MFESFLYVSITVDLLGGSIDCSVLSIGAKKIIFFRKQYTVLHTNSEQPIKPLESRFFHRG